AKTIGLSTTVPVPNKVAEVVMINPNVINTPRDTFILVSKYESSKSFSSVHFSALATEWNTKLIAIMVVPIKAIVVTIEPSGMDGIRPANTSPQLGPTMIAVATKMIPINATRVVIISSIIFGVENKIAANATSPIAKAEISLLNPVTSANPVVAPIKLP